MALYRYNPGAQPPATLALIVLNVAIAIVDAAMGGTLERALWGRGIDIYFGQWWRIGSSALVHANWMHLGMNCWGIYLLGKTFEQLQGWRAMITVYVLSALGGGALATAFMEPHIPVLGASGAAYGLMGAVLGFFYVKTGSVSGLMQVPFARQLAIWFVIGVGISLAPGISLLGHLGGFVPGALLGVYYELRYSRRADIFHHLSAGVLALIVAGLCAYAAYPWHRGNLNAGQALVAYDQGNLERGDALLRQAKSRGTSTGGQLLVTHLELWRQNNAISPRNFGKDVLLWPLTHARPDDQVAGQAFLFLNPRMIVSDDIQLDPPEPSPATNGP